LRKFKRALDDAGDQILVGESSFRRGGSVFTIRRKVRVWIYVDDEGCSASIATEPEQHPTSQRELLEPIGHFRLTVFQTEAPRRADIGGAVRCPFAIVAIDFGGMDVETVKQDFSDRQ